MAKGTSNKLPAEVPTAPTLTTVARLRTNHLASSAPLARAAPLLEIEVTNPNTSNKNIKLNVRPRAAVASPTTTKEVTITFLAPTRSKAYPRKGWAAPPTMAPRAATEEMVSRFQPNSSLMGMTKMPKLLRDPVLTKAMKVTAATTYQPKNKGDLVAPGFVTGLF